MSAAPEIIVLGAGIVGMAVAGELARRGARVTVLEARRPGQGATQASAGTLAPYTETELDTALSGLCIDALSRYDDAVARARRDGHIDVEYTRSGTLEVALDEPAAMRLRASAADLAARGVPCRWDDHTVTPRRDGVLTPAAAGSLVVETQGFVAVMPFLRALTAAAQSYGAVLRTDTRALAIRRGPGSLEVRTEVDTLRASHVVVCCGCWSQGLSIDGGQPPHVHPVRGQLLELQPRARGITRIVWGPRCYLVPWANGRLLVGATVEEAGFDERVTAAGVAGLLAAAIELVPALSDATFVEGRVGLRPASADGLPIIGPARDLEGLVYATGHYRIGVLLAPLTAEIIADLVLTGRAQPALASFAPARFTRAQQN